MVIAGMLDTRNCAVAGLGLGVNRARVADAAGLGRDAMAVTVVHQDGNV